MNRIVQEVASEYKAQLKKLYGNELVELILFGSHARGDFNAGSDVDFAVVLSNPDIHPAVEILKTASLALQLELKYGLMLSTLPVSREKKKCPCNGCTRTFAKKESLYE